METNLDSTAQVLCALAAGTVFKYASLLWLNKNKGREYVGKVSNILIYPVKSVRELTVKAAELTRHGLKYNGVADRHWLVTKDGNFQNLKDFARLTLITSSIKDNALCLDSDGMATLMLPLDPVIQPESVTTVTVKDTPLPALDCGDKAAAWICKVLQQEGLRLNYSAPSLAKRLSCKVFKAWKTEVHDDDEVAFQDFVPCMVMCDSSMDALNERLDKPITCINFRPNLMIEGTKPFDEDNWKELYIGDKAQLRYVDNCTRCLITTIDPETGAKDKDEQPLKELKRFRCMDPYGPKPVMGVHMSVEMEGEIKVGDPVFVVRK